MEKREEVTYTISRNKLEIGQTDIKAAAMRNRRTRKRNERIIKRMIDRTIYLLNLHLNANLYIREFS